MGSRLFVPAAAILVIAAAAVSATGTRASAASGPTPTTFSVTSGLLTITTPDSAPLGAVPITTPTVVNVLGTVTVNDARAQLNGSWTASVISTNFTTGGATLAETLPASDVSYAPGSATATTGTGTFTPGTGGTLDSSRTAFTASAEAGVTSCSWDPTITITLPPTIIAGAYAGTITHSAA